MPYKDKEVGKIKKHENYIKNKEKRNARSKKYYEDNRDRLIKINKEYTISHKEQLAEYQKEYRLKNIERLTQYQKKYRETHDLNTGRKEYFKEYNKTHSKEKYENFLKNKEKNQEKITETLKKRHKKNMLNPMYRLNNSVRVGVAQALSGTKNGRKWQSLVGYTLDELKNHLEKKFRDGMNWQNYGTFWHVDHSVPVSSFSFVSPEDLDFKKCWSLDNLQPLTAEENLKKHNKLNWSYK